MGEILRKKTRVVSIGEVKIGGDNPIVIQGMVKTPLEYKSKIIKESKKLISEGAKIIRIAIKTPQEANIFKFLEKNIKGAFWEADVHFNYKIALECIKVGFHAIRLNPMNITKEQEIREVVKLSQDKNIPIRVGINSGGFREDFTTTSLAKRMVEEVEKYIEIIHKERYHNIMVSLKAADLNVTVLSNEIFSKRYNYPLHLGITATGTKEEGIIKSAIGLGYLLKEGIGNLIRVSLSAPSYEEIVVAKHILSSLGLYPRSVEIISCPTCSRCSVDLVSIVDDFKKKIEKIQFRKPIKIAIMGCMVNGPGEAYQADLGVAFGKDRGIIFRKDKILGYTDKNNLVRDIIEEVNKYGVFKT